MIGAKKNRLLIGLVLFALIGTLAIGSADAALFGLFKSKKKTEIVVNETLVVFPFDQSATLKAPPEFGQDIASALRSLLSGNSQYSVFIYTTNLAPIRRAKEDHLLADKEVTAPYSEDRAKSLKLAQVLASDFFLIGSVVDCNVDSATKVAQVTLSVDLMNAKTGKLLKTMLITGRTPETTKPADEEESRQLAAGDAVEKLKAQLTAAPTTEKPAASESATAEANAPAAPGANEKPSK